MVTANIIINQIGRPPGLPGQSRDDLVLGVSVALSNENNSGVNAWNWRLLAKPQGSTAGLDTPLAATCAFTPDLAGSYLVQLLLNGVAQATAVAAVKTAYLGLRVPASGETHELGGWEQAIQTLTQQLEDGIQAGGGGGAGEILVFADDTEFAEPGTSWVTKKQFRIILDGARPPTKVRFKVVFWRASGSTGLAACRAVLTGPGTVTIDLGTTAVESEGTLVASGEAAVTGLLNDYLVLVEIQLKLVSGTGAARLSYTDMYVVF